MTRTAAVAVAVALLAAACASSPDPAANIEPTSSPQPAGVVCPAGYQYGSDAYGGAPPYVLPSDQHWVASGRVRPTGSESYLVHRCWQPRTGGCPAGQTMGYGVYSGALGARYKVGFHVPQKAPDGQKWWRESLQANGAYACYTLINK